MVLGDNLYDKNNTIMLQKGVILSEINIIKIKNYARIGGISGQVLVKTKTEQKK